MANSTLQINENPAFQARFWVAQRIAWVVIALGLVAAAFGLLGNGRMSHETIGDAAFSIHYPAILRRHTEDTITVSIDSSANETLLHFDRAFQNSFSISSFAPPPSESFSTPNGIGYRFAMSGQGAKQIRVSVISDNPGRVAYAIVADGRMGLLTTTVLP